MYNHKLNGYLLSSLLALFLYMNPAVANELYTCIDSSSYGARGTTYAWGSLNIKKYAPTFEDYFKINIIPISFVYYSDENKVTPKFGNEDINPKLENNQLGYAKGFMHNTKDGITVEYALERKPTEHGGHSTWELTFSTTDNNNTYTSGVSLICRQDKLGPVRRIHH